MRYWLHAEPVEDMDAWRIQVQQAQWIEERIFKALGQILGAGK